MAEMTEAEEKALQRKIDKQRENEARWLQKMLFASGKAQEARTNLSEIRSEDLDPIITLEDGTELPLSVLDDIVKKRVDDLMEALGRMTI
jgi:hypothetical protein